MKYVIIGAGGTGGILGFYMTKAGKDVTLIARNAHLAAMKEQGLTVRHLWDGTTETVPVKAENMETYESMIASAGEAAKPDVILVCVKGYSLDNTVPFVQKIAKKSTIVIPILNIYGTGSRLQKKLPELLVTDGCIYVSANIEGPGALVQHGKILRVVFGVREKSEFREELKDTRYAISWLSFKYFSRKYHLPSVSFIKIGACVAAGCVCSFCFVMWSPFCKIPQSATSRITRTGRL